MKQLLGCAVVLGPDRAVAHFNGELDSWTAEYMFTRLAPLVKSGREVVVNLSGLSFLSTAGLALLDHLGRCAAGKGGSLLLEDPSATVRRLLDVTGLENHFTILNHEALPMD